MCINSFMIDTDIIKCLVEDLLDRICSMNSSSPLSTSPTYYSSRALENKFQQSIDVLNQSIKQLLTYELNTVVNNGQLTSTSHIRHSRYYNPATVIKQSNELKKRLHWIEQRQMLVKQLDATSEKHHSPAVHSDSNSLANVWFDQRLKMLDTSLELLLKKTDDQKLDEDPEEPSCARCRVYRRRKEEDSHLLKNLKRAHRIRMEHNYSTLYVQYSSPESDLIFSLSKVADRIGHSSNLNASSHTKKLPTSTLKKKPPPKLHSSISLIVGDSNKSQKRTLEDSRNVSNSNFISTNFDVTNKRQKRIASPQSSLSVTSTAAAGPVSSASPHEILTPTWRVLTNTDIEPPFHPEKSSDQQENEDISDESYIHRHIRCELEQETWITNPTATNNVSLGSTRKTGTLQTSLSVPNSLSSTNSKQYRYRLTPNGIAYTETIDPKPDLV